MRGVLTELTIKSLKPKDAQYELFDRSLPGFGIRVAPGGAKSFVLVYRFQHRSRRMTLGRFPVLTLSEARKLAKEALAQVAKGIDPANATTADRDSVAELLFPVVADKFVEEYAKRKTRSWRQTSAILQRAFGKRWKHTAITDITKAMVRTALNDIIANRGEAAANRSFAELRKMLNWCVRFDLLLQSPCLGLPLPCKPRSRDRVLSGDELRSIWLAADGMDYPFGAVVKLLILTGQRRSEVAQLRWQDIDRERNVWHQHTNKSGRPHLVPLSAAACALIESLPRLHDECVFPARNRSRPLSGFSKWKAELDRRSHVVGWTLHDIRRTLATGLAERGVPIAIGELILNHRSGKLSGVAGIYNRFEYIEEQRHALDQWSVHVSELVDAPNLHDAGSLKELLA